MPRRMFGPAWEDLALAEFVATDIGHSILVGVLAAVIVFLLLSWLGLDTATGGVALLAGALAGAWEHHRLTRPSG